MNTEILLQAKDVYKEFITARKQVVHAVSGIDLTICKGETLALVGESGCGKSTLGRTLIHLLPATKGEIWFEGKDITKMSEKEFRPVRAKMQMVFQDPYASLNPRMTVRDIIAEPLVTHHICNSKEETTGKVLELMAMVGVPAQFLNRYPHQFSGGQRQRIGIARALAGKPKLIIADECIAALDASVQAQIVNMLRRIKEETGVSFLFISHDLSMVRYLSDRIGVLHLGYLLETGSSEEIFRDPVHPYTRGLLAAIPRMNPLLPQTEAGRNNPASYGIDYGRGRWHKITDTHHVLCTDREYEKWRETAAAEVDNEHSK